MPLYNFICDSCGAFDAWCDMSDCAKPAPCPVCRLSSARAVSAPRLALMDGGNRKAHTINERSADQPRMEKRSDGSHDGHNHGHKVGHGHNHGHRPGHAHAHAPSRPWMIGH